MAKKQHNPKRTQDELAKAKAMEDVQNAPVCILLAEKFTVRKVMMIGAIIGFMGMSISCLLFSIEYVIATFGVCFGIGNATIYGNCLVILGVYFKKRRSLANGLALSGSSIGQFALPPFFEYLLSNYGLQGCLLLVGGVYLHVVAAASLFRPVSYWIEHQKKKKNHGTTEEEKEETKALVSPENGLPVSSKNGPAFSENGPVSPDSVTQALSLARSEPTGSSKHIDLTSRKHNDLSNQKHDLSRQNRDDPSCQELKDFTSETQHDDDGSSSDHQSDLAGQTQTSQTLDESGENVTVEDVDIDRKQGEDSLDSKKNHNNSSQAQDTHGINPPALPSTLTPGEDNTLEGNWLERPVKDADSNRNPLVVKADEASSPTHSCTSLTESGTNKHAPHKSSKASLCIQPFYGSTIHIEQLQGPQDDEDEEEEEEEEEDKSMCTYCRELLSMFDFSVMKSYVAVLVTVSNFLIFFGYFNFVLFLPAAVLTRGIQKYEKAIMVSITGIGDLLGRLLMAAVADRNFIARYKLQALGVFLVGINIGAMVWADTYAWMTVHCALYGFFGGINVSLAAVTMIDFVGMKNLPKLLAVVMLIQGLGASLGQPLLGAVRDVTGSFQLVLVITALCCIGGALVLISYPLALRLEKRRPEKFRLLPPEMTENVADV